MTLEERTATMVAAYGEVCTKAQAPRILSRTNVTIYHMIEDGRIDSACGGDMVDVRSIARYIDQPKQLDSEAKQRRTRIKYNSEFSV